MKRTPFLMILIIAIPIFVAADCTLIPSVDREPWQTHSKMNITRQLIFNNSEVCTASNGLCSGSEDGNNYTTAFGISGTTTKTWSLNRTGMPELTGTYIDIDTNDTEQVNLKANASDFIKTYSNGTVISQQINSAIGSNGTPEKVIFRTIIMEAQRDACIDQLQAIVMSSNNTNMCIMTIYNNTKRDANTLYYPGAKIPSVDLIVNFTTNGLKTQDVTPFRITKGQVYHVAFNCVGTNSGTASGYMAISSATGISDLLGRISSLSAYSHYNYVGWQYSYTYNGTLPTTYGTNGVLHQWSTPYLGMRVNNDVNC